MTIQELAEQETLLYSEIIELCQPQTPKIDDRLKQIFAEYREVHQAYADMANVDIEALKRGLFIQWYAMTEPSYLTGIDGINKQDSEKIIQVLKEIVAARHFDYELAWMLTYYLNWPFAFEIYNNFKDFDWSLINGEANSLPETIDREAMKQRGQMGVYLNSLSRFRNSN
ncbi:hypothetical protein [Spirosoma aerolatum]|uniref:hypothetical protein n=1 Tax=Spirosoma aerolatum TaxID=1211326 RepID=UPI0009AC021E|nr:hypothetical protein [Spirosoma aerolatum]